MEDNKEKKQPNSFLKIKQLQKKSSSGFFFFFKLLDDGSAVNVANLILMQHLMNM